tara:strand:+ start:30853 stop:31542 length:690 start_codon:yes stop_codon:yes gene_type:complete
MPWIKRKLRGNSVYVRVDAKGEPCKNDRGLVEVVYKLKADSKIYNASWSNLIPTGEDADEAPFETDDAPKPGEENSQPKAKAKAKAKAAAPAVSKDAVIIYTDGACSKNPGPMGIGAVIVNGDDRREISEFLGIGTNNIAELAAIGRALEVVPVPDRQRMVVVHTDSSYCIGVLDKGWKAKANTELIMEIRKQITEFGDLHFVKVKGHAGIPENERCDELATTAVSRGS